MAHIASCIAELDTASSISKPSSPVAPADMGSPPAALAERPYNWRMQPPEQQRRYQLFPKDRQLPALNNTVKPWDGEKASVRAKSPSTDNEKPSTLSGLRIRINQHNMARWRKASVPDTGPMTTVQEVPMDSPTIPGRPALHERSISAPGNSWLHDHDDASLGPSADDEDAFAAAIDEAFTPGPPAPKPAPSSPKLGLPPLVIPESASRAVKPPGKRPFAHARSESTPIETTRFRRVGDSPRAGHSFTPSTSMNDVRAPVSAGAGTAPAAKMSTPVSAPVGESSRASPAPWERRCVTPMMERATTPHVDDVPRAASATGHRRGASESSSIMDRGRPRKRVDARGNATKTGGGTPKSGDPKGIKSPERRAFEELPEGWKPSDAVHNLSGVEAAALQRQAQGQAERFEILRAEDVESLSKELRSLDERTEYLRRTYTSLRTGRRNLHTRICQYLRSPRVARFSYEAMLKQEEALAELDASIDDWVTKLEKAENRRTRVRQKLLEHVAAAAILPGSNGASAASESLQQAMGLQVSGVRDISTPPRSPSRPSFSPPRSAPANHRETGSPSPQRVVAQVPSTIVEQPAVEETAVKEAAAKVAPAGDTTIRETPERPREEGQVACTVEQEKQVAHMAEQKRADVESIRVYAGDDVYTLLADVEKELSKMSVCSSEQVASSSGAPELKRTQLYRQKSRELLGGSEESSSAAAGNVGKDAPKDLNDPTPVSPPAPTPPMKDGQGESAAVLLSKAVFKP